MSEELNLRQAAERLIYWCGRIERASTESEENECCNERDKLFAVFRKVDAERADGKAQRPEGTAQREARSEHIPTPEGRGGEELSPCPFCGGDEISHGFDWPPEVGIVQCHTCDAYITANTEAAAIAAWNRRPPLLSSPRVEEVRREALEEAAKVADKGWSTECASIARRIRALSPPVG